MHGTRFPAMGLFLLLLLATAVAALPATVVSTATSPPEPSFTIILPEFFCKDVNLPKDALVDTNAFVGNLSDRQHSFIPKSSATFMVAGEDGVQKEAQGSLEVSISADGTVITATVKNSGKISLDILKFNSLFDGRPVRKIDMFYANKNTSPDFKGLVLVPSNQWPNDRSWTRIDAGMATIAKFEANDLYDLNEGGKFTAVVNTSVVVRAAGTKLNDTMDILSNKLELDFEAQKKAAGMAANIDAKLNSTETVRDMPDTLVAMNRPDNSDPSDEPPRNVPPTIADSCGNGQIAYILDALWHTQLMTGMGSNSAVRWEGNDTRFYSYFGSSTKEDRCWVVQNLQKISQAAANGSRLEITCSDDNNACASADKVEDTAAYTVPHGDGKIVLCDAFFDLRSTATCSRYDMANVLFHAIGRVDWVLGQPLTDYPDGYCWPTCKRHSSVRALVNIETYAWYAHSAEKSCNKALG